MITLWFSNHSHNCRIFTEILLKTINPLTWMVLHEVSILYEFGSGKDNNCHRRNVKSVKTGIPLMSDCKHLLLQIHRDIERNAGYANFIWAPKKVEDQLACIPHLLKSLSLQLKEKTSECFAFCQVLFQIILHYPQKSTQNGLKTQT